MQANVLVLRLEGRPTKNLGRVILLVAVLMKVEGRENINSKAEKAFKVIRVTTEQRCTQPVF